MRDRLIGLLGKVQECGMDRPRDEERYLTLYPVNEKGKSYRCNTCGRIFTPILESGKCDCGSAEKTLVERSDNR